MSEQSWYYRIDGAESGPFRPDQIQKLTATHHASAIEVRKDGTSDWLPFSDMKSRMNHGSELESLEDIRAIATSESELSGLEMMTDLSEISLETSGPSMKAPAKESAVALPPPIDDCYYQSNGTVIGPVSRDLIIEMAATGQMAPDQLIRLGRDAQWIAASEKPAIAMAIRDGEAKRLSKASDTSTNLAIMRDTQAQKIQTAGGKRPKKKTSRTHQGYGLRPGANAEKEEAKAKEGKTNYSTKFSTKFGETNRSPTFRPCLRARTK